MERNTTGKGTRPFSIRLTETEKAVLGKKAGKRPLGQYARQILLGDGRTTARKKPQSTSIDHKIAGQLLALLGKSELADNLARIARQAEAGTLYCDENLHAQIRNACEEVRAMRGLLMRALGKETGGAGSRS